MIAQLEKLEFIGTRWTEEDVKFLKRNYRTMLVREIASLIEKTIPQVRQKAQELGLRKKAYPWTERELQYLENNYGLKPAAQIARTLKRSTNALKIIAYRKLNGLNQRANIYTARSTAEILGVR